MSVTTYNNTQCKYCIDELDKVVYLLSEDDWKISIDNGEAYVSGVTATPLSIEAYAVELSDSEALDERYKFTHTLKFSVNGYSNYKDFGGRYYAIVKSKDNTYWLLNPMFPCKVTYTYTLGANENHTDFEMATVSNHPMLRANGITNATPYNCNGYAHSSFKTLKLNEKAYSTHNTYFVQYTNDGFKDVVFNKNSQTFTETFDGTYVSHSIKFDIRLDYYKSSWHYNLLEFQENLYSAIIGTSDGKNILVGFNFGFHPSFNVTANSSSPNNIEVTLTNTFDNGDFVDIYNNVYITKNTDLTYIYTTEYDGWECVGVNTARYLLKKQVDAYGNATGNYQCFSGYRSYFEAKGLTIVGTFSSTDTFYSTSCTDTCKLNTNMPNRINFNTTGCKTYSIKADTNWSISSNKNFVTVSPASGVANSSYTVSVCNSLTPTSATSSATLTLNYCNRTSNVNVYVAKDSCFPQGNRYIVTAQGQYVTIPTQCCISAATESSNTLTNITIQNGYIKVYVPEYESTASSRSFTVRVYKCNGDYEDVTVSQLPLYERWRLVYGEWICDECSGTTQYRWVNLNINTDWVCEGTDKYYKQQKQISYDGGSTWYNLDEYRTGSLYQTDSPDCGYVEYRWVNLDPTTTYVCVGYDKYYKQQKQVSYDGGSTWNNVIPSEYRTGVIYQTHSSDCGYVPPTPTSGIGEYLTFDTVNSGTFKFSGNTVEYSLDSGATWVTLPSNTSTPTVNAGKKIMWRASLTPTSSGIGRFSSTNNFNVEGNPMSLLYGDNFSGVTSLADKSYAFYGLFRDCTWLRVANRLWLTASELGSHCYEQMFYNCSNMIWTPSLSATTLATSCYKSMFTNCAYIQNAPELPATALTSTCYNGMFYGCSGLTETPTLPATQLGTQCYREMFSNCVSLTTASSLPATTLTNGCYWSMFRNCYELTTAPDLSASTLADFAYAGMFQGCSKLSSIKCLATDISASNCTSDWMKNVASSGTFTKKSNMSSWTSGINGIPNNWTINNV